MIFFGLLPKMRNCRALFSQSGQSTLAILLTTVTLLGGVAAAPSRAWAQEIIATVNGQPITDLDLSQREKLMRVLRQPTTRDAAMQSLIDDALENQETSQFGVKPSDAEIGQEMMRTARKLKIAPEVFFGELQRSGASDGHIKDHFSAELSFFSLMQAFHKGVEASENQIDAELAKEGGKSALTQYRLRQVIFVIPTNIAKDQSALKGRVAAAEQLRARFSDCDSGLPLARSMDNVAVREEIIRDSLQLGEQMKQLFDKTPTGHLTPPSRSAEGIEMIAVCGKSAATDDSSIRAEISQQILAGEIDIAAQKRLQELRSNAVIVKKMN